MEFMSKNENEYHFLTEEENRKPEIILLNLIYFLGVCVCRFGEEEKQQFIVSIQF